MECPKCQCKNEFQITVQNGIKYVECKRCHSLFSAGDLRNCMQPPSAPYIQPTRTKKSNAVTGFLIGLGIFTGVLILAIFGSALGKMESESSDAAKAESAVAASSEEESSSDMPAAEPENADATAANPEASNAPAKDTDIPWEYKSALNKANDYSNIMHMSKIGIYDQLTSEYGEKFSAEAAQYAIDHIQADWNANALESAKKYIDTMYLSKAGVYDQLTSAYGEQFTPEEAQYAIDHVQADWNANALITARQYQNTMDMSPESIRDQLTSEYGSKFTPEEADFAIRNLN